MKKAIIGGIVTLVIGGTTYTISQTDVVNNFSKETGMSKQQAQQYVDNAQKNLESFSKIGTDLTSDGNTVLSTAAQIDCANYSYTWETSSLSCDEGQSELNTVGNNEVAMGNCYASLGTDLGSAGSTKINECISDIDALDSSYDLPIATALLDSTQTTDMKNANLYNKSVLEAALKSN
jgi:hypothetical protein